MQSKLELCPFCGGEVIFIYETRAPVILYQWSCCECGRRGPHATSISKAAEHLSPIEAELRARVKELEAGLAEMLSKYDTLKCYMCHGGRYFEYKDWDRADDEHKQNYINKAREWKGD